MTMNDNYVITHCHSVLSNGTTNVDSTSDFHYFVDKAKELGMKAFAFSEHGNIFAWLKKKEYIEKQGMKYIHAVEAYLTQDSYDGFWIYKASIRVNKSKNKSECNFQTVKKKIEFIDKFNSSQYDGETCALDIKSGEKFFIDVSTIEKSRLKKTDDNYHIILIAKNYEGVKEINLLTSNAYDRSETNSHFYGKPRIYIDDLVKTSDNVIVTSACLGGVFNKGTPEVKERLLSFMIENKHRCFFEIQHHNCKEQIEYNKMLYELSKSTGIKLVVGTDTHEVEEKRIRARRVLQLAKDVYFEGEDDFDLVMRSYDELIDLYKKQNSLPIEVVKQALEQTNVIADMVEEFSVDKSAKYPKMYDNSEEVFKRKINEGVVEKGINKLPNKDVYYKRIHEEFETYKHNNAIDFMLLEEDYKREMRARNVKYGYSRGSVSGSVIAYILGITYVDSVKYNLNFERFMNRERVSLADVDTDWLSEDREKVKDYLYNKDGLYCCEIVTFNTIALKGAVKDVCRGLFKENILNLPKEIREKVEKFDKEQTKNKKEGLPVKQYSQEMIKEIKKYSVNKYIPIDYLKFSEQVIEEYEKDEAKTREKYKDLFYLVDMLNGVVVSVGNHPAATVVSPFPVDEWFGTFMTSKNKHPISVLNMKEIDSLNFVKLDILGLTD